MLRRAPGARERLSQQRLDSTDRGRHRNGPHPERLLGDLPNVASRAAMERCQDFVLFRSQVDQYRVAIRAGLRGRSEAELPQQLTDPLPYSGVVRVHVHVHAQDSGTGPR